MCTFSTLLTGDIVHVVHLTVIYSWKISDNIKYTLFNSCGNIGLWISIVIEST